MRKFLLITGLLLVVTICTFGQSRQDQTQILQACIDLPELQPLYPLDANLKPLQIIILEYHPVMFPSDLPVTKFGKALEFVSPTELSNLNPNGYLLFKKFEFNDNFAVVELSYNYKAGADLKVKQVDVVLKKINQAWLPAKTTIQ